MVTTQKTTRPDSPIRKVSSIHPVSLHPAPDVYGCFWHKEVQVMELRKWKKRRRTKEIVISNRKRGTIILSSLYFHILTATPSGLINVVSDQRLRDGPLRKEAGCVWRCAGRGTAGYRERYLTTIGSSDRLILLLHTDGKYQAFSSSFL